MTIENPRRRRSGRHRRQTSKGVTNVAFPVLTRNIPVYDLLPMEAVELIDQESCRILEEIGIEFRDDESAEMWRVAGADVSGHRIKIDRSLLMTLLAKVPSNITLNARNPERNLILGGRNTAFLPGAGMPYIRDFEGVRRYSRKEDLYTIHRLTHAAPQLQSLSSTQCEPMDVQVAHRHLYVTYSCLRWSDKPFMSPLAVNSARAKDVMDMVGIVFGKDFIENNSVLTAVVNCNSPLVWDATMLDQLKVYAKCNQPAMLSPFALGGASTSASTIGAVAQVNAEALAGIAFTQLVRAGSPQIYGQFMLAVDLQSGAPMGGTPEAAHMMLLTGQMARRYNLPFRTSGFHVGSKLPDAQAGYESNMLMHAAILCGAHYIFHSAGWLENGLCFSYEKFMLDCDQVGAWYKYAQGVDLNDLAGAMEAIREVGPGGHFLGTGHTLANFETAFYRPALMDFKSFEQWTSEGAKDAATRAREMALDVLNHYEEPALDQSRHQELLEFIKRREREIPRSFE